MKKKYILISILFIMFTIIMGLIFSDYIVSFDDNIYNIIFNIRNNFFDNFFKIITTFGNTITILCITIALLVFLSQKERYIAGTTILLTVLLNQALKYILQRPRPNHMRLINQGGYSFPSGHAMISIAVYGFLIYFVAKKVKKMYLKYFTISILIILTLGIGISRIYLGVHYPSDVLAGYILSLMILIIVINVIDQEKEKI